MVSLVSRFGEWSYELSTRRNLPCPQGMPRLGERIDVAKKLGPTPPSGFVKIIEPFGSLAPPILSIGIARLSRVDLFPSFAHLVNHKVHQLFYGSFFRGAIEGDLSILQ
jgi:hypothetical protein